MKVKILGGIFALAITVAAGYGVNKSVQHDADLSDMALSNVEALADGEVEVYIPCMRTCYYCWCYYPPIDIDPNDYFIQGEFYLH